MLGIQIAGENSGKMTEDIFEPCFWEFEALANFEGEKLFQHPDAATRNILRAGKVTPGRGANDWTVAVTAYSYEGIPRLTYVTKRGRDGNDHQVPVEWVEYVPVQQTVPMAVSERANLTLPGFRALVGENDGLHDAVFHVGLASADRHFRRNLIAFVDPPEDAAGRTIVPN